MAALRLTIAFLILAAVRAQVSCAGGNYYPANCDAAFDGSTYISGTAAFDVASCGSLCASTPTCEAFNFDAGFCSLYADDGT